MFIIMCFVVVNYVRKVLSLVAMTGRLSHQVGGWLCPPVTEDLDFFPCFGPACSRAFTCFTCWNRGNCLSIWACLSIRKERLMAQSQILHEQPTGYWWKTSYPGTLCCMGDTEVDSVWDASGKGIFWGMANGTSWGSKHLEPFEWEAREQSGYALLCHRLLVQVEQSLVEGMNISPDTIAMPRFELLPAAPKLSYITHIETLSFLRVRKSRVGQLSVNSSRCLKKPRSRCCRINGQTTSEFTHTNVSLRLLFEWTFYTLARLAVNTPLLRAMLRKVNQAHGALRSTVT